MAKFPEDDEEIDIPDSRLTNAAESVGGALGTPLAASIP